VRKLKKGCCQQANPYPQPTLPHRLADYPQIAIGEKRCTSPICFIACVILSSPDVPVNTTTAKISAVRMSARTSRVSTKGGFRGPGRRAADQQNAKDD